MTINLLVCLVSEAQGAASVAPSSKEQPSSKPAVLQPLNRLARTPDIVASTKQKEEQVTDLIFAFWFFFFIKLYFCLTSLEPSK